MAKPKEPKKEEVPEAPAKVEAPQEQMRHDIVAKSTHAPAEVDLEKQMLADGVAPSFVKKVLKAKTNLDLMDSPRVPSVKAVSTGVLLDPSNPDAEPVKEFTGIFIYGEKNKAFYAKAYVKGSKERPDCYSLNARAPEPDSPKLQNPVCKTCPQNKFETARAGKGKACRDVRKMFFLENEDSILPKRLNITPASIGNFESYLTSLVGYGLSLDEVVTKVTAKKKDADDPHVILSFSKVKALSEDDEKDAQTLKNWQWVKKTWLPIMSRQSVDDLEDIVEEAADHGDEPKGAVKVEGQKVDF